MISNNNILEPSDIEAETAISIGTHPANRIGARAAGGARPTTAGRPGGHRAAPMDLTQGTLTISGF